MLGRMEAARKYAVTKQGSGRLKLACRRIGDVKHFLETGEVLLRKKKEQVSTS